jgi:hypothetical protein
VACVQACFTGHSHKNDFWFEDLGVLWAYGRAGGFGGYGGEILAKGCKIIDLWPHRLCFETVTFDNRRWGQTEMLLEPDAGIRGNAE